MDIRYSGYRLPPQRYTIPRLLQMAANSQKSFDLSKFTYDAARAGVIPQLGDIAMPTRRISSQRSRGWSSESFEPSVGKALLEGNAPQQAPPNEPLRQPSGPLPEPRRQPSGPPVETKAQKDAGFARFLKKHASPTHNRVTAGGRIVPMEKRESPPKFDLSSAQPSGDAFLQDEYGPARTLAGTPMSPDQDTASNVLLQPPPTVDREDSRARTTAQNDKDTALAQKDAMPLGASGHGYNIMSPSLPAPSMFEPSCSYDQTQLGMNYPLSHQSMAPALVPVGPAGWQYNGLSSTSAFAQDIFDGVEPTTRLLVSSQNCLSQAEAHFNNLDRQLKAIDRHRAMSHHDPSLAAQRYAIVQKRSEAKELVSRLVAQVEALQSLKGPLVDPTTSSGLMGGAQPFVPQRTGPLSCNSSRPPTARGSIDMSIEADYGFVEKPPSAGKRKIIPIVAPPESPSRNTHGRQPRTPTVPASAACEAASGELIAGPTPGTIDQSTMQQRVPTKTKSHADPLDPSQIVAAGASNSAADGDGPQVIRWTGNRPGSLPVELEEWTESYYDALRLPEGVITVFAIDDDVWFEVRGAHLQRPNSVDINDTERQYWSKKPVFTKMMLDELRSKAEIVNAKDYGDDFLLGRTAVRAMDHRTNLDDTVSIHSDEGGVRLQNPVNMRDLLEEAIRVEAGRRRQAASAPQPSLAVNSYENRTDSDVDLSNKGYSSVSVQSINATVRLPPSFDGTTENKTRNAKAVLTAANRNRSPRVLHRSSPQGGA